MDNLKFIIGPAPSEVDKETYIKERLSHERQRVRSALEDFKTKYTPSKTKKAATRVPTKTALKKLMDETQISFEDLKRLIEEAE